MSRFASFASLAVRACFAASLVVGLSTAHPARATVLAELDLDELAGRADAVVFGQVRTSGPRMMRVGGQLRAVTVTRIDVREWVKGEGEGSLTVVELGGSHADGETVVEGTPSYGGGEWVVAFLSRSSEGAHYRTLGMAQGKFRVLDGRDRGRAAVVRDLRSVSFARVAAGQARVQAGGLSAREPLAGFLARVRRAARQGRTP